VFREPLKGRPPGCEPLSSTIAEATLNDRPAAEHCASFTVEDAMRRLAF
jgi:hypothetical protein